MAVSLGTHASFTIAMFLGMAVFLLLMMPVTHAEKDISLEIIYADSFEVIFNCRYNYDGDMTDVVFGALKGSSMCLEKGVDYQADHNSYCDFFYLKTRDPKILEFKVMLDRSCDQIISIRCRVSNKIAGSLIQYEDSIKVPAQSDPPIIYVNGDQPVEASSRLIEVACVIRNVCGRTKLNVNVSGDVALQAFSTTHSREGGRFTTTARGRATFSEPGNYTIVCHEERNEDNAIYSKRYSVTVYPSYEESDQKDVTKDSENDEEWTTIGFPALSVFGVVGFLVVVGFVIFITKKKKVNKAGQNSVKGDVSPSQAGGITECDIATVAVSDRGHSMNSSLPNHRGVMKIDLY